VSDQELEDIVKVGYQNAEASELARTSGGAADKVSLYSLFKLCSLHHFSRSFLSI
jgi:hypothetical protein